MQAIKLQKNERNLISKKHEAKKSQRGASLVEYALLVALIAVIAIVTVRAVGLKVSQRFSSIDSAL